MKNKINSLVAIIKDQNRKINEHKDREEKLREQNEKLRAELMKAKDANLMNEHTTSSNGSVTVDKKPANVSNVKNAKNAGNRTNTHEN